MKTLQFEGKTIKYDERAPKSWRVQRALACGEQKPVEFYDAIDTIFGGPGKSDEIADMFDGDASKVLEVLDRISAAIGGSAKN